MALLVTIGTDGQTNWVRLPSGQRLSLGSISVLRFVTKLVKGGRTVRQALDRFLREGEAMVSVSEEAMWDFFTPVRSLRGSISFMARDPRGPEDANSMATIHDDLSLLEGHIEAMNKAASATSPEKMREGCEILVKLAQKIKSPNQSKNTTYYNLGEPKVEESPVAKEATSELALNYDSYKVNNDLAQRILVKAEETVDTIERLASEGKKFNAGRAKADVHAVTVKLAGILRDVDLTTPWVGEDLQKLASRTDYLHGLFVKAKS